MIDLDEKRSSLTYLFNSILHYHSPIRMMEWLLWRFLAVKESGLQLDLNLWPTDPKLGAVNVDASDHIKQMLKTQTMMSNTIMLQSGLCIVWEEVLNEVNFYYAPLWPQPARAKELSGCPYVRTSVGP